MGEKLLNRAGSRDRPAAFAGRSSSRFLFDLAAGIPTVPTQVSILSHPGEAPSNQAVPLSASDSEKLAGND